MIKERVKHYRQSDRKVKYEFTVDLKGATGLSHLNEVLIVWCHEQRIGDQRTGIKARLPTSQI
jgi:hypothetical protein